MHLGGKDLRRGWLGFDGEEGVAAANGWRRKGGGDHKGWEEWEGGERGGG
jgi:hypothetical protein